MDTETGTDAAPQVVLVEPARTQVLALAAQVLGRLPADEVPGPLRAIARFAPAKRRRLGAVALGAALDTDEGFRERVAETIAEASPELTGAVRTGASTAAADPIDVAVVAYLTRPAGWRDVLAGANERWSAEHGAAAGHREELDRLRAELAELRGQVRAEPARVRDAVRAAVEESEAELANLRRALRDRTRELRGAERERDEARTEQAELRARLEAQASAHDAELRRLRARQADAARSAETARRDSRAEREVDDARLWLLVDTLQQAASGVRRELSLSPTALRPADSVDAGAEAGGAAGPGGLAGRSARDAAMLDRLLALPQVHLIVDGYNVTKTGYPNLSLADQRGRLVGALAALAARSGAEVTVAFDGAAKPPAQPATPRGVRVLFSAADEIADDLIRRLVAAEPAGRPLVVVTSDQQVVADTGRGGAWTAPSAVLLARLG